MKKLINAPDKVVDEALAGMAAAHPDLIRIESPNIVVRKDAPRKGKVGIIWPGDAPMQILADRCNGLAPSVMTGPHHGGPVDRRSALAVPRGRPVIPCGSSGGLGRSDPHLAQRWHRPGARPGDRAT